MYGLLSALFVTFTLAFTDFGAPKIVGGNYNVLADLTLSFKHYDFSKAAGAGMNPYWNSIIVSLWTAVAGTIITFLMAYAVEKMKVLPIMRNAARLLAIIPLALPGLVIGIAYILFFNIKGNPLHIMYGTISILVLANMVHFFSVSYVTASSALKKLDTEFESVSSSLGIPFYRTMVKVTVPMTLGAILEIGMYYFINSMVTISAVVFLYAADLKLASVAIVNMDDAGDVAPAAALSMLIVLTSIAVRLMYELITSRIRKKNERWQQR